MIHRHTAFSLQLSALLFGMPAFSQATNPESGRISNLSADSSISISIHAHIDSSTTAPTWLGRLKYIADVFRSREAYELFAEAQAVSAGHAWISVRQGQTCTTYGLFEKGPVVNEERSYPPGIVRTRTITEQELEAFEDAVSARSSYRWMGYYNCASYASDLWKAATGEFIDPVAVETFYVDSTGDRHEIKRATRLRPLPPSPIGVIQSIIRLGDGTHVTVKSGTVCP